MLELDSKLRIMHYETLPNPPYRVSVPRETGELKGVIRLLRGIDHPDGNYELGIMNCELCIRIPQYITCAKTIYHPFFYSIIREYLHNSIFISNFAFENQLNIYYTLIIWQFQIQTNSLRPLCRCVAISSQRNSTTINLHGEC